MTIKNKFYLLLSILVLFLTFVAILQEFETILFIGFETEIIWIPIWIGVVFLPLLNVYEIAVNPEKKNMYYWFGLLINSSTIVLMIRYFKIELLP